MATNSDPVKTTVFSTRPSTNLDYFPLVQDFEDPWTSVVFANPVHHLSCSKQARTEAVTGSELSGMLGEC